MATTREELQGWFRRGVSKGATHMLVVCDTFDWSDYPVFVMPGDDVRKLANANNGPNMTKLMEVYDLSKSEDEQIAAGRVFNY
jgi:hypothetical protein